MTHDHSFTWVRAMGTLQIAIADMMNSKQVAACVPLEHRKKTPQRVVAAYGELFNGCFFDPKSVLKTAFSDDYDEMVYVNSIGFVSMCAHHLLPFFGKAHFAYIPNKSIVGLSKIPRLIAGYAHRPQVQEKLTKEIVTAFQEVVKPKGCALVMEAVHLCMSIRGVKCENAHTKTTYLLGAFRRPATRAEFLHGIPHEFKVW